MFSSKERGRHDWKIIWGLNIPMPQFESCGYELPGGTAIDYSDHICELIDNLSRLYHLYTETDYQQCRSRLVDNVSNCMTDRAAANHVAILLVNEVLDKTLTELNCRLSPPRYSSNCSKIVFGVSEIREREGVWQ